MVAVSFHGVSVAMSWARDLPNRIVIDEEVLSVATPFAVTESYHAVFRDDCTCYRLLVKT